MRSPDRHASFLFIAAMTLVMGLTACGRSSNSEKLARSTREASALVDDDDDAPFRPESPEVDTLDELDPDQLPLEDEDSTPAPNVTPPKPVAPAVKNQPSPQTQQRPSSPKRKTAPPLTAQEPAPKKRITARGFWDDKKRDGRRWTAYTVAALDKYGRDLLKSEPSDVVRFCPAYSSLRPVDRLDFWVKLISALAARESSFDPTQKYAEGFSDSKGRKVISRGLLQLSLESAKAYGCEINSVEDLHDAQKNLECGVRIMNRWVIRDDRISGHNGKDYLGIGRYWSPFRNRSKSFEKIRSLLSSVPVCRGKVSR